MIRELLARFKKPAAKEEMADSKAENAGSQNEQCGPDKKEKKQSGGSHGHGCC